MLVFVTSFALAQQVELKVVKVFVENHPPVVSDRDRGGSNETHPDMKIGQVWFGI